MALIRQILEEDDENGESWKVSFLKCSTRTGSVVNNVAFSVIDLILAVLFFVRIGTAYMDYRKHGQFEFTSPAILFACLIFTLTAPLYLWGIIGM